MLRSPCSGGVAARKGEKQLSFIWVKGLSLVSNCWSGKECRLIS